MRYPRIFIASVALVLCMGSALGQARMVLNNNVFVTLQDSAHLVLESSNTNALSTAGTGGNLVTVAEASCLDWHIGTATGTYTIPLSATPASRGGSGAKIPIEVNVTGAGSGSGMLSVSSYETADDNTPYAGGVTHMNSGLSDQSLKAIDRFWVVDARGFTTAPTATIAFTYDDNANEIGGSNTVVEGSLQAQRWNASASDWEGLAFGTVNTTSNRVSGIPVSGSGFHSVWTLVDNGFTLPVELLYFKGQCAGTAHLLEWATASETNNDRFEVQQSTNGRHFETIATLSGQGTTSEQTVYQHRVEAAAGQTLYYRLMQVDADGTATSSSVVAVAPCHTEMAGLRLYPNPARGNVTVELGAGTGAATHVTVVSAVGAVVHQQASTQSRFQLPISQLAAGTYYVRVQAGYQLQTVPLVVKP